MKCFNSNDSTTRLYAQSMNPTYSFRKHRGSFQPVNTLLAQQEPSFATEPGGRPGQYGTDSETSSVEDHSASYLGDSSSLFEGNSFEHSPQCVSGALSKQIMAREREPPVSQPSQPPRSTVPPSVPASDPLQHRKDTAPLFGQTSNLESPLKQGRTRDEYAHLFNKLKPGQRRPEHFQTASRASVQPFDALNRPAEVTKAQEGPHCNSTSSTVTQWRKVPASYYHQREAHWVPVIAPLPYNPPAQTSYPPPRPIYSSTGQANGFQPVNVGAHNPLQAPRQTIILDDEDDNFDPDAKILAENDQFGAPDIYAYVDSGQAGEKIKALLEGTFDEADEKIPRPRLRQNKKKKQQLDDAGESLAKRLQALEVKNEEAAAVEPEEPVEEEDDGTVEGLKVKLLPHQVDGVAWMMEKETGMHNKRAKLPKGGILADDMGLGKTVQSIALILSNPRPEKGQPENKKNKISSSTGKGTLVVAPLALIKQWEAEVKSKVCKSQALKVLVHHGPNRTKSADKLKEYDVVVTTYQVLASEHASCGAGSEGLRKGCFAVEWYRTMLDEAHTIKNRNAKMTKACYAIRSHYRWCLTGTPMQNNLDELQSLIHFLRIQPYCEMTSWKESISFPMKNGRGNLAMRRLQIFLKAIMKRRTKDVLKKDGALNFGGKAQDGEEKPAFHIVARNVETIIGEFTAKEREFYDRLSDRAQSRLDEMMGGAKQDYMGALVLLLRLRQACNHPTLTKTNFKDDNDAMTTGSKSGLQTSGKSVQDEADELAGLLSGLSVQTKRCDICQLTLTGDDADVGAVRCRECERDLNASAKRSKKRDRKHRKHKLRREKIKGQTTKLDDEEDTFKTKASGKSRQRRIIVDSDDEGEAEGEWLVPENEQHHEDLGKAGGTDDENAEGDGDTVASVDSHASASEDESRSEMDSFIVHDTESEDEASPTSKKISKQPPPVVNLISDDDGDTSGSDSGTDSDAGSEEPDSKLSEVEDTGSVFFPSTKIRQLLLILEKETPDHKVIVFSQFTSMLDLIEPFLEQHDYSYTRYDGGMRNDLREASLHKLRHDKSVRVLLCSLKCGSLGLNLTAASRVVIMEPFWNPFVEEQAIDRVHRLNQTVDVTVYRLSIHNSVEERILELQDVKRKLADAALEGGKAISKLSMKDILALFKREAEYEPGEVGDDNDSEFHRQTRKLEHGLERVADMIAPRPPRKADSGASRKEDSVYGRR